MNAATVGANSNASVLTDAVGVDPEELNVGITHVGEDAIKNAKHLRAPKGQPANQSPLSYGAADMGHAPHWERFYAAL